MNNMMNWMCWPAIPDASSEIQRESYLDLHYDRYTTYVYHDRARSVRDYVPREFKTWPQ